MAYVALAPSTALKVGDPVYAAVDEKPGQSCGDCEYNFYVQGMPCCNHPSKKSLSGQWPCEGFEPKETEKRCENCKNGVVKGKSLYCVRNDEYRTPKQWCRSWRPKP